MPPNCSPGSSVATLRERVRLIRRAGRPLWCHACRGIHSGLMIGPSLIIEIGSIPLFTEDQSVSGYLTKKAVDWIVNRMRPSYAWPGNMRELEQCVRNVMIRKYYTPAKRHFAEAEFEPSNRFAREIASGRFTQEQLTEHYVSMIYAAEVQHYGRAAKRLDMDWRTLKLKLNQTRVEMYSALFQPRDVSQ